MGGDLSGTHQRFFVALDCLVSNATCPIPIRNDRPVDPSKRRLEFLKWIWYKPFYSTGNGHLEVHTLNCNSSPFAGVTHRMFGCRHVWSDFELLSSNGPPSLDPFVHSGAGGWQGMDGTGVEVTMSG